MNAFPIKSNLPVGIQTVVASIAAAAFRVVLMPIDTVKTTMQAEGRDGMRNLLSKINSHGIHVFSYGSTAAAVSTLVRHNPWFIIYNFMSSNLPGLQTQY